MAQINFLGLEGLDLNIEDEVNESSALARFIGFSGYTKHLKSARKTVAPYVPKAKGAIHELDHVLHLASSLGFMQFVSATGLWTKKRNVRVGCHPLEQAIDWPSPAMVSSMFQLGFSARTEPSRGDDPQLLLSRAMQQRVPIHHMIEILLNAGAPVEHPRVIRYDPLKLLDCSSCIREGDRLWKYRTGMKARDVRIAHIICARSSRNKGPYHSTLVRHYYDIHRHDLVDVLVQHKIS